MDIIRQSDIPVLRNSGVESAQLLFPESAPDARVTITQVTVPAGGVNPRHRHEASEQTWVALAGRGTLLLGDGRHLIPLVLLPALLALAACSRGPQNEDQAVELLSKRVIADKLYPASQNGACLAFQVEQSLQNGYEIAVREKHGSGCPGDPGTGPVIDRFEVQDNGKLRLYDPVAGNFADYVPAERTTKP